MIVQGARRVCSALPGVSTEGGEHEQRDRQRDLFSGEQQRGEQRGGTAATQGEQAANV